MNRSSLGKAIDRKRLTAACLRSSCGEPGVSAFVQSSKDSWQSSKTVAVLPLLSGIACQTPL
jgi:hypothetical protein